MRILIFFVVLLEVVSSRCVFVRRATYPEPRIEVVSPPPVPLSEVYIKISDGSICGWLNEVSPSSDSSPVVLFLHGNGDNLQTLLRTRIFGEFARMKVHLLAIDYPGYGNSVGIASERSLVESTDSAIVWLAGRYPLNPRFVVGFSMGAGVAVQSCLKHESLLSGMVLIAPWTSLDSVAVLHYPRWLATLLLKDKYRSIDYAPDIDIPVLVLHGEMDRTIPVNQGKKLAETFSKLDKWQIIKGAGHNDLFIRTRVWEEIEAFLFYSYSAIE